MRFNLSRNPVNWAHTALALAGTALLIGCSVVFLPERFIDYGIMSAFVVWSLYAIVSQWSASLLRRAISIALAIAFLTWIAFVLWPFDYPM